MVAAAAAAATIVVIVGKHLIEQSSARFRTPDYRRAVNGLLGSLRNNRTYYATCLRGRMTSYSLLNRRRTIFYSSSQLLFVNEHLKLLVLPLPLAQYRNHHCSVNML